MYADQLIFFVTCQFQCLLCTENVDVHLCQAPWAQVGDTK